MTRWERLEEYLFDHNKQHTRFATAAYAEAKGFEISEASMDVQSYLRAQRRRPRKNKKGQKVGGSQTLYVLSRVPGTRTTNALWKVGIRVQDARSIGRAFSDDVEAKVMRALRPDLLRLGERNPKARDHVERQIRGVVDGAMKMLELAAQGSYAPDDEAPDDE